MAALDGSWSWLAGVAGQAIEQGSEGFPEDTLAGVQPWGGSGRMPSAFRS
jgi:hypothetical protein